MHHQKRKKKLPKKRKTSNSNTSLSSELYSYDADSPLTNYVEKVSGVNSTDPTKIK